MRVALGASLAAAGTARRSPLLERSHAGREKILVGGPDGHINPKCGEGSEAIPSLALRVGIGMRDTRRELAHIGPVNIRNGFRFGSFCVSVRLSWLITFPAIVMLYVVTSDDGKGVYWMINSVRPGRRPWSREPRRV